MLKKFGWATVFAVFGGFCAAPAYALHLPGVGAQDGCGQVQDGFAEGCDGIEVQTPITLWYDITVDIITGEVLTPADAAPPVYRLTQDLVVVPGVGGGFEQGNEEAAAPSRDNRACAGVPLSLRYILCPNNL